MYYFIVNPVSRSGQGMEIWKQTERILKKKKLPYRVSFTKYRGHGTKLARTLASQAAGHTLVIIGGDGTVNEVLNGLPLDHSITLGYLPVGSGNDFARGIHLPSDPREALNVILSAKKPRSIDVGTVGTAKRTARFSISSGLGYDAAICYEASHTRMKKILNKLHLGSLTYAYAAIKLLFTFRPADMDILLDGSRRYRFTDVYFVTAMNLQYEGGGFRFCPAASARDGALDYLIIHNMSKLKILLLFPTAYFGKHTRFRGITILRGKEMRLHSSRPCMIHRDGEFGGISDTITFRAEKQAVDILLN